MRRWPTARTIRWTMICLARCSSPCWGFRFARRAGALRSRALNSRSAGGRPREIAWTGASFERHFYPVGGAATHPVVRAVLLCGALSQAGRGRGGVHPELRRHPSADPRQVARHPRSDVLLPASHRCARRRARRLYVGNEVAFDGIAAFNAAMQSEVRQELRAHYRDFPRFTGLNTHFPMNLRAPRSGEPLGRPSRPGCAAAWRKD